MDLIIWLVIGGVIGWLASIVMKTNAQMGIIANVIVGIVGAFLGGWLAGVLGIAATGAWLWLVARIAYAILYATGTPVVRTIAWFASLVGLVMMLIRLMS